MEAKADSGKHDLASRQCVPCKGGTPPLGSSAIQDLLADVQGWKVVDDHRLERTFPFADFAEALTFVNRAGAVAEAQGHHPDIYLAWGKATVQIWTHKINGLTESDFILAAKFNEL